ncbi:17729_t:CDS:2 [Funneliformis caledonium]|uniref:17729_t:CDS:1 n=1 Tax=Funneliformis caledonium TaxID=1117310 RepID=A0A9N9DX05_9GLOM|nr:17729_t:CDS:2 [Funneliformis caledonium]
MKSIIELLENPEAYSNPKKFLPLPFLFLDEQKSVERFFINDDDKFIYMGRKAFVNVLNTINELKRGRSYMDCFIYDTISHELVKKLENYIKLALFLTYIDNIEKIIKISTCKTTDDIVAFCESSELLYFIVDQMNALDYRNNTEIVEVKKATILDVLNRMTPEYYCIKSSSANNESALYLIQKQTNDRKIKLYGGFDEDEMSQWWMQNRKNLPSVNEEQKKKIEYDTGKNPLF